MNLSKLFSKMSRYPLGKKIFSLIVCNRAPYFGSISPTVQKLETGVCEISMRKRRAVFNHIKTVHAIAMCNLCELSMGLAVEAGLPKNLRWIPKSMSTNYLQKANSDLISKCQIKNIAQWEAGNQPVFVQVFDKKGLEVMNATINLWITIRPTS